MFSETEKAVKGLFVQVIKCQRNVTRWKNDCFQMCIILNNFNGFIVDYTKSPAFLSPLRACMLLVGYPARHLHHKRVIDFCYRIMQISFQAELPFASKRKTDL